MSLQEKQKVNLLKMLDFNQESNKHCENWSEQWKILIYDAFGRDIISPILKLHQLRKKGVTLHLPIDVSRDAISDVPAIYFVTPSQENIEYIIKDCKNDLYSAAHINFISPLKQDTLEYFARRCVEENCRHKVAKVMEQYIGFVSLEPNLFTLHQSDSYKIYNAAATNESAIVEYMQAIANKLFSVFATSKQIPVIRAPKKEGPAQYVAKYLSDLIQSQVANIHLDQCNIFQDISSSSVHSSFQRPVLIIMDRNEDIPTMLHHPSTYQALVDDLLGIAMNRVKVPVKSSTGIVSDRTYELDVTSDPFFKTYASTLFPDAIDANEKEMKQVTRKEEEIRAKTSGNETLLNGTKDLVAAVDTLPALMEKKKVLEVHTNIFQAAFEIISARQIPAFSMLEQKLIHGSSIDKAELLHLITDGAGSVSDKMRLLMIYFLTSGVAVQEVAELESKIEDTSFFPAWKYIKKHTALQKHASVGGALPSNIDHASASSSASAGMSKFKGLAQGFLAQAAASVKNFLPENKKLHITRVTDAICELRPNTENDEYLYFDPKITSSSQILRQRTAFREAVVFMIGGGNFNEYHNLMAYAQAVPNPKEIWYGCTELLNAQQFLEQLNQIES